MHMFSQKYIHTCFHKLRHTTIHMFSIICTSHTITHKHTLTFTYLHTLICASYILAPHAYMCKVTHKLQRHIMMIISNSRKHTFTHITKHVCPSPSLCSCSHTQTHTHILHQLYCTAHKYPHTTPPTLECSGACTHPI